MDKILTEPPQKSEQDENEFNWTAEEFKVWYEAGLIPSHLTDSSNMLELHAYMKENKKKLRDYHHRDYSQDYFQMIVPPPNEWHKAPDIPIIDRRTGNIVSILEMSADFEICEGVSIKIKAKERRDLEKETNDVKKLNKEQHNTFVSTLRKISTEKPLSRKEIATLIEEVRKPERKAKKYRQSGHLVDQKLKYQKPSSQLSLFDVLLPETKQKIEESSLEIKAEGIKLSYAENKLIHAINILLCEKSQSSDTKRDDFYTGNVPAELVPYGVPNLQAKAPVIKFKPSELYKAFMGHEYSGVDIKYINNTLKELCAKKFLIKYDRIKIVCNGKKKERLTDRIEDFQSLISILSFIPDLRDEEKKALDAGDSSIRESRGEIIIALNPIFHDQIDTKYIEFPEDVQRQLVIAAGGHKKVTASMQRLMEYMLREISVERYNPQINEETLPYVLGLEQYVKQKRNKLLQERIEKDVQAIMNMGIIIGFEKQSNSTGGIKWVFRLNKDYE